PLQESRDGRITAWRSRVDEPDHRERWLLPVCGVRPCGHGTDNSLDEVASSHCRPRLRGCRVQLMQLQQRFATRGRGRDALVAHVGAGLDNVAKSYRYREKRAWAKLAPVRRAAA